MVKTLSHGGPWKDLDGLLLDLTYLMNEKGHKNGNFIIQLIFSGILTLKTA